MKTIILDTNFLLLPAQRKVDIFSEIGGLFHEKVEIAVLDRSLQELEQIAQKGRQKEKLQVNLAKALLKTQNIKILPCDQEGSVDDLLVEWSQKGYTIATEDKELRSRIQHNLVTLRQGKYLIFKD